MTYFWIGFPPSSVGADHVMDMASDETLDTFKFCGAEGSATFSFLSPALKTKTDSFYFISPTNEF